MNHHTNVLPVDMEVILFPSFWSLDIVSCHLLTRPSVDINFDSGHVITVQRWLPIAHTLTDVLTHRHVWFPTVTWIAKIGAYPTTTLAVRPTRASPLGKTAHRTLHLLFLSIYNILYALPRSLIARLLQNNLAVLLFFCFHLSLPYSFSICVCAA